MWKRLQHRWNAIGDLVRLRGLDDRLLADMGLEREGLSDRVLARETDHAAPALAPCACRPAAGLLSG